MASLPTERLLRPTPRTYPPNGFLDVLVQPDADTVVWSTLVADPEVCIALRHLFPQDVASHITQLAPTATVFFLRTRVPMRVVTGFGAMEETQTIAIPTGSSLHAAAVNAAFYFGDHPRPLHPV